MQTTLKIFGCSDRIKKLNLPKLLQNKISFGLNHFSFLGAKTTYWLWLDCIDFGCCVYKATNLAYTPYLKFTPNFEDDNHKGLFGAYTVATFAIDFAIKEGFKRVELYGILDGEYKDIGNDHIEYKHFYNNTPHIMHKHNLQSWKNEIMGYNNKIEIVIPYQTV